jgi:rhodanese-related sulfurtransferase/polyisoprenoid-binding protein YceI
MTKLVTVLTCEVSENKEDFDMTTKNMINTVSVSDLRSMDKKHHNTHVVDVLPPDHFANVHIPGAKNACVFFVSFLDDLATIVSDKKERVVVYGSSERSHDAKMAIEKMTRAGFLEVYELKGGIEAWRRAGYACEGNAIDQPDDPQTTLSLSDGTFIVDNDLSTINWEGRNPSTSHFGTVGICEGLIHIRNENFSGKIEVDMNSIHNINLEGDELQPVLEAHLRSDDFFFTSMFPKAVLNFKEVTPIKPLWQTTPNFHVKGELMLRGVSASLDFDMTASLKDNNTLTLEAHFDIDRTRWNIIYGSTRFFEHLGMHKVFELISLQIRITATR